MIHHAAAIATALKLSALMAFSGRGIQPVRATDLKLNIVHDQEGRNALVPLDGDVAFYCGRAADLDKPLSNIELFETKTGEDGHPRCLDVEDEVMVVAHHPSHGFGKKQVAVRSIRGGQQDVEIVLGRPEQDLARRGLKSWDIVKFGEVPYPDSYFYNEPTVGTITVVPEEVPLDLRHHDNCVIDDIDVLVTVLHEFGASHDSTLIHDGTSVPLAVNDGSGTDYYSDPFQLGPFDGQSALGDWDLVIDMDPNEDGGYIEWILFVNCKDSFNSLSKFPFHPHLEDAQTPETADRPSPDAGEETRPLLDQAMKAKMAHCTDGQDFTRDSFKTMDDATKDCLREVWAREKEEIDSERNEGLDGFSMSMP